MYLLFILFRIQRLVSFVKSGHTQSFFRYPEEQQSEYIHLNREKSYFYSAYFVDGGGRFTTLFL